MDRLLRDRRWYAPLAVIAILVLALAWWRPWRAAGVTPSPTPVASLAPGPAPTATRDPERIALPTERPPVGATPSAVAATPRPATPAGPRAWGTILYAGTLDGQPGIVAADADGTGQRLLVAGQYDQVTWDPGGLSFAASGPLLADTTAQVAVFDADGRPLARHAFEGRVNQLLWSPDGGRLAVAIFPTGAPAETWQVAICCQVGRVQVPDHQSVAPFAWTPAGLLLVVSYETSSPARTLWSVSADGTHAVREYDGTFLPVALSPDGEVLYALAADPTSTYRQLVAVALRTDARRPIADADRLAERMLGVPVAPGTHTFFPAAGLAPGGGHLAVVVERVQGWGAPGTPSSPPERTLAFLWPDGTLTGTVRLPDGGWPERFAWSPDGTMLAFRSSGAADSWFLVVGTGGNALARVRYAFTASYGGPTAAWSPDGRWLAYAELHSIAVVSPGDGLTYQVAPVGGSPSWRPTP